jgi:hypothetical protein
MIYMINGKSHGTTEDYLADQELFIFTKPNNRQNAHKSSIWFLQ